MRTPENILEVNYTFINDLEGVTPSLNKQDLLTVIKIAQTEAWNEAVDACAKNAYDRMYNIGEYEKAVKESILKLKI